MYCCVVPVFNVLATTTNVCPDLLDKSDIGLTLNPSVVPLKYTPPNPFCTLLHHSGEGPEPPPIGFALCADAEESDH